MRVGSMCLSYRTLSYQSAEMTPELLVFCALMVFYWLCVCSWKKTNTSAEQIRVDLVEKHQIEYSRKAITTFSPWDSQNIVEILENNGPSFSIDPSQLVCGVMKSLPSVRSICLERNGIQVNTF